MQAQACREKSSSVEAVLEAIQREGVGPKEVWPPVACCFTVARGFPGPRFASLPTQGLVFPNSYVVVCSRGLDFRQHNTPSSTCTRTPHWLAKFVQHKLGQTKHERRVLARLVDDLVSQVCVVQAWQTQSTMRKWVCKLDFCQSRSPQASTGAAFDSFR